MKSKNLLAWFLVLVIQYIHAQPINGYLDSTFGGNGIALFDNAGQLDEIVKAAYGADGKLYVTGNTKGNNPSKIFIARYNADGTLDPTFGIQGKIIFSPSENGVNSVTDMHLTKDNKMIISGYAHMGVNFHFQKLIARFNMDGSLDITFNQAGYVLTGGPALDRWMTCWVQDNGRIIAAGFSGDQAGFDLHISKFKNDGTLDLSFGFQGTQIFDFGTNEYITKIYGHINNTLYMIAMIDDKTSILAIDSTGKLISTFGDNGRKAMNSVNGFALNLKNIKTYNNDIYTCGYAVNIQDPDKWDVLVAKLDNTGNLYTNFGAGGFFRADLASTRKDVCNDFEILTDGSILGVGGKEYNANSNVEMMTFLLALDGTLYSSYGTNGIVSYLGVNMKDAIANGICMDAENKFTLFGTGITNSNEDGMIVKLKTVNQVNTAVLQNQATANDVLLFPNPVNEQLYIEVKLTNPGSLKIDLCNMNGMVINSMTMINEITGVQQINLSNMIENMSAGVYYLTIKSNDSKISRKLVKN
jgi:uncharacterized delta-60 repeat protein